jgi:hypothetical protein
MRYKEQIRQAITVKFGYQYGTGDVPIMLPMRTVEIEGALEHSYLGCFHQHRFTYTTPLKRQQQEGELKR